MQSNLFFNVKQDCSRVIKKWQKKFLLIYYFEYRDNIFLFFYVPVTFLVYSKHYYVQHYDKCKNLNRRM